MKNKSNIWLKISIFFLLLTFVSATVLCLSLVINKKSKLLTENLIKEVVYENSDSDDETTDNLLPISVDFKSLLKKNKDIIAWIYCKNTQINYPIVQSEDNQYYLRRLLNGTWAIAGTLFVDYRNSKDFSDPYTVIYGHNMRDDTIFGSLHKYSDPDYWNEHSEMYIFTPEINYRLDLVSGFVTTADSDFYKIYKDNDIRDNLFREAVSNSLFLEDSMLNKNDRLVVLSTCSHEYNNARYVLIGILNEIS